MIHSSFNRLSLALALVALLINANTSSAIGPYRVIDLGDLPGGADVSSATDINSLGQIAGTGTVSPNYHAFLWHPVVPNGDTGSMHDLGDLPGGLDLSSAQIDAINEYGQVVGRTEVSTGQTSFMWKPSTPNGTSGTMHNLGDLPGGLISSEAAGINNSGQVVGHSWVSTGPRAYLWKPSTPNGTTGTMFDLGDLPGGQDDSGAYDINESGQVVGFANNDSGNQNLTGRAFIWNPTVPNGTSGTMHDMGELPGGIDYSVAHAINASGQAAGWSGASAGLRAFFWQPTTPNGVTGTMTDLGILSGGSSFSQARGIGSSGEVVGQSDSAGGTHAFYWSASDGMLDLNSYMEPVTGAGWVLQLAGGINNSGQIVGYGLHNGVQHAFLLMPVPEPSTVTMLGILTTAYFGFRRRSPRPRPTT